MSTAKTSRQYYLGIDPSAASTGLALKTIVDGEAKHGDCTTIAPPENYRGAKRLDFIFKETTNYLARRGVGVLGDGLTRVCIEGAALYSTNKETILSQVRGVFLLLAYLSGECEPTEIAPTQLKKFAVGSGSATKEEIIKAIAAGGHWKPDNDDEADACGLADMAHALDYYETITLTRPQLELTLQLLQGKALKPKLVKQSRHKLNV